MSVTVKGHASCEKADRYIQRLVKHWSHKFETTYADGRGEVPFPNGAHATFDAEERGIEIVLAAATQEESEQKRGVIERHIDRFAFREAPLEYSWSAP